MLETVEVLVLGILQLFSQAVKLYLRFPGKPFGFVSKIKCHFNVKMKKELKIKLEKAEHVYSTSMDGSQIFGR